MKKIWLLASDKSYISDLSLIQQNGLCFFEVISFNVPLKSVLVDCPNAKWSAETNLTDEVHLFFDKAINSFLQKKLN